MITKNHKVIIKLAITISLILVILAKVKLGTIVATILGMRLWFIPVLLLISVANVLVSCLKWQLFLKAKMIRISMPSLICYYYIGDFFNNFLPTSVGGDLMRGYLLGKDIKSHTDSYSSVFLERLTGVISIFITAIIAVALNIHLINQVSIMVSILVMIIILVIIVLFFVSERMKELVFKVFSIKILRKYREKCDMFYHSVYSFRNRWDVIFYSMAFSFSFRLLTIINVLVCCWAIRLYPNILDIAVTVPIISALSFIPVSLNGVGLKEGLFAYFFLLIGISPAKAISVALMLRAKALLNSLVGGVLYMFRGKYILNSGSFDNAVEIKAEP